MTVPYSHRLFGTTPESLLALIIANRQVWLGFNVFFPTELLASINTSWMWFPPTNVRRHCMVTAPPPSVHALINTAVPSSPCAHSNEPSLSLHVFITPFVKVTPTHTNTNRYHSGKKRGFPPTRLQTRRTPRIHLLTFRFWKTHEVSRWAGVWSFLTHDRIYTNKHNPSLHIYHAAHP